jgi:DNA-binding CsgD family transcriptional regulator
MRLTAEDALRQAKGDRRSALWLMMMELPDRHKSPDEPYSDEDLSRLRRAAEEALRELEDAQNLVGTTPPFADPGAVDDLIDEVRKIFNRSRLVSGWCELPRRQQQIAKYVARGRTSEQIAAQLFLNPRMIAASINLLMTRTASKDIRQLRLWIAEQRPGRLGLANLTGIESAIDNKGDRAGKSIR